MSENYKKLIQTLRKIFEMDKADLDFGIYRIMNQKRNDINKFLEQDLLPQVKEAFVGIEQGGKNELQKELEQAIEQAKSFGVPDPENSPPVLEIKKKMSSTVDISAIEQEVFSHLHTFFNRYYDQGDFISLRRYKDDTYAIPYEGEEVKLHWANSDQYYIKSTEHFREYAFRVKKDSNKSIRIKLMEADTEKDNTKSQNGERRFVLDEESPLSIVGDELHIHFNYIPKPKTVKQDKLNKDALECIFKQDGFDEWLEILKEKAPTEKNPDRTILEKHLYDYTARNTFDYFIHKDLGKFLRRELDFYIKNEVLYLDDIESESISVTEHLLRKIKAIRVIATKIITFLSQIEDFQKKMWLKKKFVVETNYCVTLDRVPEDLYNDIVANERQIKEWIQLFAIDEIKKSDTNPGYSKPLHVDFLKANDKLLIDTRFYDESFKTKLLLSMDNIDKACGGLLLHSENFQVLNLLQKKYSDQIKCIYIDPPYNTDSSEILYKNGYRVSSWNSLINNNLRLTNEFLAEDGILCATIDDEQQKELSTILSQSFGRENNLGTICIRINPSGRIKLRGFAQTHEYALFFGKSKTSKISKLPRNEAQSQRFNKKDDKGIFEQRNFRREGSSSERISRPRRFFPLFVSGSIIRIPDLEWNDNERSYKLLEEPKGDEVTVYPIDSNGGERVWRWGIDRIKEEISEIYPKFNNQNELQIYYKYRPNEEGILPTTIWVDKKYSATEYGTAILKKLFGDRNQFSFPKSIHAVEDCLRISSSNNSDALFFDYFAGSGTTAHAVINLNREDNGNRNYILAEVGSYFNTALKPRIAKTIYSEDWRNGKPTNRDSGLSHFFKYQRLESYEDTLNNLILKEPDQHQQSMLDTNPELKEDYMLSYCLDIETKDSASLLDLEQFENPFDYKLNIGTESVGVTKPTKIDLVETFNYLLGLTVKQIDTIRGFKVVVGQNPQEESVLVIWRVLAEKDNTALEEFMDKSKYHPRDTEFDHIYVNGDHTLEDPHSKVKMIEIEFKRLMFDVQDV